MSEQTGHLNPDAGTARLWIVIPVTMLSFFYAETLGYLLPLYFSALHEVDPSYPADMFSQLMKYQVTPWFFMPIVAGLLSRRYGERRVWCFAQIGMAIIPLTLILDPQPNMVKMISFWSGVTGAMMWISGISLIQMVRPEKKGLANGLMMGALGVGSFLGPLCGRALLYRQELGTHLPDGDWSGVVHKLLALEQTITTPQTSDFVFVFWILVAVKLTCGVMVGLWAQRPGHFAQDEPSPHWDRTVADLKRLLGNPRFWALVGALCLLGGPLFQATNQFLPYRAEDLGLKSGAEDHGWIWLQLVRTAMWIPGGLAVGLLAGRRAPGIAAVTMLGCFAITSLGMGWSTIAWELFACAALFEFTRQFMRWSHAGYLSEHMPEDLRATAIGCSITISGLGATTFAWVSGYLWDPNYSNFQSSQPFLAAAALGLTGCVGLFIFDRFIPIRQAETTKSADTEPGVVSEDESVV